MDLALNNQQRLICHKTQQTKPIQTKLTNKPINQAGNREYTYVRIIKQPVLVNWFKWSLLGLHNEDSLSGLCIFTSII